METFKKNEFTKSGTSAGKNNGYSMVELIIALVIIGILTAISLPYIVNFRRAYKSEEQARRIMDLMKETGQLALTRRKTYRFEIDLTAGRYLIIDERGAGAADDTEIKSIPMESAGDIRIATKETNIVQLGWNRVGNVGTNPDANGLNQGIFLNGIQPIMTNAGPDQVVGRGDDNGAPISGYSRQIIITDQCDPDRPSANCPTPGTYPVMMRSVQVIVFYNVGNLQRQESLTTVLTFYRIF